MNKEKLKKLAKDPRFISGIYNYCDRWCERCQFTSKCMTYVVSEEDDDQSKDINNKVFWDKIGEPFKVAFELLQEKADELGIDLDDIDYEEAAKHDQKVHEIVENQPYTKTAFSYVELVDKWFKSNKNIVEAKADEIISLAQAQIPGTRPDKDALKINDCFEIIRWYQHQIYVKLCRAASGMIRGELEDNEYAPEDANGSAKVAIIGIERSTAAWAGLLNHFTQQESLILDILVTLKKLLRLVDSAFPDARAFIRPGFDTPPKKEKKYNRKIK